MKTKEDNKSEILDIIKTKDWGRARSCNNKSLYNYILRHKDTDENCKIIWEHINIRRDCKSEVLEIIRTKDWDRAKSCNYKNLYNYIYRHRDTDENCKIIWNHIRPSRDYKSEISEIIETEDWDRARRSIDDNLYQYVKRHRDTDENCKIIWEHISKRHYTIKDYLLYYFEHGESKRNNNLLHYWINNQIKKGDRCCIDVKNLIVAAENFQDPVALETLELIKNHLKKEGT